jgi:PAS domain S-box-containing protein
MQELIQQLPGVIYEFIIHPDGSRRFAYISPNCEEILGLPVAVLMRDASAFEKAIVEEDRELMNISRFQSHEQRNTWSWEGRIRIGNRTRWIEARSIHTKRGDDIVRRGIILDIDHRKKQEQERIKKDETLFTQLFNTVPMAVVMLDEFGKVRMVNHGFNEMFGFELLELRGKNLNDFIVPDNLRHEGIDLNNLIASNKIICVETVRRKKDGKLINVILYGVPVLLESRAIGIYGVYVDITQQKQVEEELKIRNIELDNFVYKVSHDLRAPLSSILGLVNLSRLPGNTDSPLEYINIIGKKIEDLDHFINDVLIHSKNLKLEVTIDRIDFEKIISRNFADLNYLEGATEVELTLEHEGREFYSDPWRISEIFRNLVSNAIKYRQLGGAKPMVSVRTHVTRQQAEIVFTDNGIGIAQENLNRIFEMFYRAAEQSDGSGIGLYIVKNAVDKLNGTIDVASKLGFGTTFTIVLPNLINTSGQSHSQVQRNA